jgi:hypothetical protein
VVLWLLIKAYKVEINGLIGREEEKSRGRKKQAQLL